ALSGVYRYNGLVTNAVRAASEAKQVAQRIGAQHLHAFALIQEAWSVAWTTPRGSEDAIRLAEQALAALPTSAHRLGVSAHLALANSLLLGGRPQDSMNAILQGCGGPDLTALPPTFRPMCLEMLTAAAVEAGDTETAKWADRAESVVEDLGTPRLYGYVLA